MIDDESKKFIKDTIDNAIDRKFKENNKKSEYQKRSDDLKLNKKTIEEQKKFLAELKELNKKGETTIAQKFEILKLSIDTAIPQDFKDAVKVATPIMKQGAGQIGRGISKITEKAMMLTPLTAFLYQNRDIFGAIGDIAGGTLKVGWGGIRGTAHGALGLFNNVKHLFKSSKESQETTDSESQELRPQSILSQTLPSTQEIFQQKEDWQGKIDQIHEIVTSDIQKEQKKTSTTLFKGLKGLTNTMDIIKDGINMITTKQKLIAGGVLLGTAALVGLFIWIKSGGLSKLLDNIGDNLTKKFASKGGLEARQKADKYIQDELNKIDIDANSVQKSFDQMNLQTQADFSKKQYKPGPGQTELTLKQKDLNEVLNKEGVSQKSQKNVSTALSSGYNIKPKIEKASTNKVTLLWFPFKTKVQQIYSGKDDDHVDFVITRTRYDKKVVALKFINAIKDSVKVKSYQAQETIAKLDVGFFVLGDRNEFFGINDKNPTIKDVLINERKGTILQNANQIMDEPYHTAGVTDAVARYADTQLDIFKHYEEKDLKPQNKSSQTQQSQTEIQKPNVTENKLSSVSTNTEKAKEQNKVLNTKPKIDTESISPLSNTNPQNINEIPNMKLEKESANYKFADTNLAGGEYYDMIDSIDMNGVK